MKIPLKSLKVLVAGMAALVTVTVNPAPLHATPGNLSGPVPQNSMNNSACANAKPPKGAGKFTGRIVATPSGDSVEINAGKDSAIVTYTNSTLICQGGQTASPEALVGGLSLTAYGEMNRVGKTPHVAASLIMLEGKAASTPRLTSNTPRTNANSNINSGSAPSNDPASNPSQTNNGNPPQNNSDSFGRSQNIAGSNLQQNKGGAGISCESMTFSIAGGGAGGAATGKAGGGRTEVDGLTCVRPVDQQSMQLMTDGIRGEHMASVSLNWPNEFTVTLTNAFISSVTFTSSGSQPVAQITFLFTRIELRPAMGGSPITLEGKP